MCILTVDLKLQTSSAFSGLPGGATTNAQSADCLHQSHDKHNFTV